jgi:PKD repeat protein
LKTFTFKLHGCIITLLFILFAFVANGQKPQSVSRGEAQKLSDINFLELAAYELAHPPVFAPRVRIHESEEEIPSFYAPDNAPVVYDPVPFLTGQARTGGGATPPPVHNFTGLNDNNNGIPPDVSGVAGPNHVMEVLNTQVRVYFKNGTGAAAAVSLNGFWTSLGNPDCFDPKIYYDPYVGRWIFITVANGESGSSALLLAVSQTSDPTGVWNRYLQDVDASNINWFDFPSVGFNNKWICVMGNMFTVASNSNAGSQIYAFNKASMYAGGPASYTRFTGSLNTVCPAQTMSSTQDTMFLLQTISTTQLRIYRITGAVGAEVFGTVATVSSSAWGNGNGNFAPQYGSPQLIDVGDYRMQSVVYRNGYIWAAHTAFLPPTGRNRTIVQWWQLSTIGSVIQKGRIEDPFAEIHFSYPSIAVNAANDVFLSYTRTGQFEYPNCEYSLRLAGDPANTMRPGYRYKIGEAWYFKDFGSGRNRWGDYTAACVDPVNDTTFWALSEYSKSPSSNWATWWAEVHPRRTTWADFSADTTIVCNGQPTQFTDLSTVAATSWSWTFQNATPSTSTLQNPSVVFNGAGTHNVTLVVNGTDTMIKNNYVLVLTIPVNTVALSGPTTFCQGDSVSLTASVTGVSWLWNTGDTTRKITVYTSGTYFAVLTNAIGCTNTTVSTTVTVNPLPTVSQTPFPNTCDTVNSVPLTGGSPAGGTYSGTAVSGNVFNPSVSGAGTFPITYTYTDGNNCSNSAVENITVDICLGDASISPNYEFSVTPNPAHNMLEINFTPKMATALSVNLSNELGQQVFTKNIGRTSSYKETVDVSTLPAGIYFLTVHTEKESAKVKVIIE